MSRLALLSGMACGFLGRAAYKANQHNEEHADLYRGIPVAFGEDGANAGEDDSRLKDGLVMRYDKSLEFVQELADKGITPEQYDQEIAATAHLPRKPVKMVIVGGGYAGAKTAAITDSLLDVTLVDEKNFYEMTQDIIPIIANPWSDANEEALKRCMSLHRFYLKRSNIVTGTAESVSEEAVTLKDGRRIAYDVLVLAHGKRKPFPFRTKQRTITGRVEELKQFNKMLQECKNVAVVGAGPMGTMLASELAGANPDKKVSLFHRRMFPASNVTNEVGYELETILAKHENLSFYSNCEVNKVIPEAAKPVSCKVNLTGENVDTPAWWEFWRSAPLPTKTYDVPMKYNLEVNRLGDDRRPEKKSILYRVLVGEPPREPRQRRPVQEVVEFKDFDYVFDCSGYEPSPLKCDFLEPHTDLDGRYRVSKLCMMVGHPNMFAVGSCNSFPWTHTLYSSDCQVRSVFKILYGIGLQKGKLFVAADGVKPTSFGQPQIGLRLYGGQFVCNANYGGIISGVSAVREFAQDRSYLMKEFKTPKFYKKFEIRRFRDNYDLYFQRQTTEITDFEY